MIVLYNVMDKATLKWLCGDGNMRIRLASDFLDLDASLIDSNGVMLLWGRLGLAGEEYSRIQEID